MGPRVRVLSRLGALAGLAAAGCLPEVAPAWSIEGPQILAIDLEILATGPLSTPLAEDAPWGRRNEGLAGDRIRIRPIVVDVDGPVALGEVIVLRCLVGCQKADEGIPPCAEDGLDGAPVCRAAADEVVFPPLALSPSGSIQGFLLTIAAAPGAGISAEECLSRAFADARGDLTGCLFGGATLPYGPSHRVAELLEAETAVAVSEANRGVDVRYHLVELTRAAGSFERALVEPGAVVEVAPGDRVRVVPKIDPEMLQDQPAGMLLVDEEVNITWWATAPIFSGGQLIRGDEQSFTVPAGVDAFDLHMTVRDRPLSSTWTWLRFAVGPGEGG